MTPARVFRVALDTPLKRLFDYLPPESILWGAPIEPGMRVRVPFGRQKLIGIVMEAANSSDVAPERLKPILEVLAPRPVLDASALALLRWAAEYYHHPIGEVLSTALPKAMRMGAAAEAHEERWSVTPDGREAWLQGEPRRAPKQRELLGFLVAGGEAPGAGGSLLGGERHQVTGAQGDGSAPASASGGDGSARADDVLLSSAGGGVSATALDEALPKWRDAAR